MKLKNLLQSKKFIFIIFSALLIFVTLVCALLFTNNNSMNNLTGTTVQETSILTTENTKLIEISKKYGDQTVYFVPAFPDSQKDYLRNVKFYDKDKNEISIDTSNITMNGLYQALYKDKDRDEFPKYASNSGDDVVFYGVINESWDAIFRKCPWSHNALGLNQKFKNWLNSNNLKTIYFANNEDSETSEQGNWSCSNSTTPTINNIEFSCPYNPYNPNDNEAYRSTFYGAYGGFNSNIFNDYRTIKYIWSSCWENDYYSSVWVWDIEFFNTWENKIESAERGGAILSLTF